MTAPDAILITSSFGGGWIIPQNDNATDALAEYFGGEPSFWGPVGETGWLVEPNEIEYLAQHTREHGLTVKVQ